MTDRDLDGLTRLLGQCLNQIDEQAARLFVGAGNEDPGLLARLDAEAGRLQDLVASIVHCLQDGPRAVDLDLVVGRAVRQLLDTAGFPLVVRERLAGRLPPAACDPARLRQVVQRGLALAADHAGSGGEIIVTTRGGADGVVFQLRCRGGGDAHLAQRAVTLQEFVADLQGHCEVRVGQRGDLCLSIELPVMLEPDDR